MLTKLLKYEARTTARMLLPIYAGTVLAWGIARVFRVLCSGLQLSGVVVSILQALLLGLYGVAMMAAGLMTVFVNIRQFYRLLGEDGYFLIPLPASAAQHMATKLLCGMGWMVVYCLLGGAFSWLEGNSLAVVSMDDTTATYFAGNPISWGAERLLNVGLVGLGVLLIVCGYLFVYLCVIIGGHWPQRRALASVLTYLVLNFASQVVFIAALMGGGNFLLSNDSTANAILAWLEQFVDKTQRVDAVVSMLWVLISIAAAALAVAAGILWAIDHHFVSKRLNIA